MKRHRLTCSTALLLAVAVWSTPIGRARAVGTAFTYQGRLQESGRGVDGACDLEFRLFDDPAAGSQIGGTLLQRNVAVASGLFTVRLDFGASPFTGPDRWLQVGVRCPAATTGSFTALTPRQPLTATPYALLATAVADDAVTGAKIRDLSIGTTDLANGAVTSAKIADGTIAVADVDTTSVQRRVTGTCPAGTAIRAVNADGTVTCQTTDVEVLAARLDDLLDRVTALERLRKDVRTFGATGSGVTDDTAAVQAAIEAARAAGGGIVYFPKGIYFISRTLVVNASNVQLVGEGRGSVLDVHGNFDTLLINGSSSSPLYGNAIKGLRLAEYDKSGGRSIVSQWGNQLRISDVVIDSPFDGIHLHDFNDVTVERTYVAGPRGTYGGLLTGGGPSDVGRSDVIDFQDVVFSGAGRGQNRHGLIIDGQVSTVSAHKIYFTGVDGVGLWIRNTIASHAPEFATFYGLEADFPYYEGIQIQHGQRFYFTDTQVHQSQTRSNIYVGKDVNTVSFKGGFSSGARYAGIDVFGNG